MKKRNNRLSRYVVVWSLISVLTVGFLMLTIESNQASETKEGSMNIALKSNIESPGIPSIDASVPSVIETASFGLG